MCKAEHVSWVGTGKAHCPSCCETFSTVGNFDKHRPKGFCLSPSNVGLHLNKHGVWVAEGEVDYDSRFGRQAP